MIDVSESIVAHMMINAGCLFCCVKIFPGNSKSVQRADITGNKQVINLICLCFCLNLIHSVNIIKHRLRIFQIDICLYLRIIFPKIEIQSHTGTDAVSIRTDVAADAHCFYIFQYF